MTSQSLSTLNSNIVNLFAEPNVTEPSYAQRVALPLPLTQPKKRELNGLPLQVAQLPKHAVEKKSSTWLTIALVLLTHALVIYLLSMHKPLEKIQYNPVKPMMVSIIAPPSPEPEIVPIIEPPKPEPKPIIKPKKVVEKILPIEKPVERLVEATTEPPKVEEITKPEAAPVLAAEPTKEMPKAAPVIEEKIEPPRFGVAYLNNPTPDYPALSVRKGEEGRVLMMVLVSADGAAEDVQIEKSSGFDRLDNAAVAAVKKWRFIPAKKNNQPMSAYVRVPMPFILEN